MRVLTTTGLFTGLGMLGLGAAATAEAQPQAETSSSSVIGRFQDPTSTGADAAPLLRVRSLQLKDSVAEVGLEALVPLSPKVLRHADNRFETIVGSLSVDHPSLQVFRLLLAEHPDLPLRPIEAFTEPPSLAKAPRGRSGVQPRDGAPFGQALAGRTVFVSPGHGRVYVAESQDYEAQRPWLRWRGCGDCRGIVEDNFTHSLVVHHLLPLLEGAGARVLLPRERDRSAAVEVVDNSQSGFRAFGPFAAGAHRGGFLDNYLVSVAPEASATWDLTAPSTGPQSLSVWLPPGETLRPNLELSLHRPSKPALHWQLAPEPFGGRWFHASALSLQRGEAVQVRMRVPSARPRGGVMVADAVRLGSGLHPSGHPWWSMGAKSFVAALDAPSELSSLPDPSIRPAYAEWRGADVFVSVHSNASGRAESRAGGTVSYRYSCRIVEDHSTDPNPEACDAPSGSDRLQSLVHTALVDQLRHQWDPEWRDRGPKAASFLELRGLRTIPGVLIETAFHDNTVLESPELRTTDNQALHDPRWRSAAAWGIYEGISRFLEPEAPLLLPPPTHLRVHSVGDGLAEIHFASVEGARGYQLEVSVQDRVFLPFITLSSSPSTLELNSDEVSGLRLRTLNPAGYGPPSPALSVRTGSAPARVLIIDSFQREDAWVQEVDNRRETALTHGLMLDFWTEGFDSAEEGAVANLELAQYQAIIVATVRESSEHAVLTPRLRGQLRRYVEEGGALLMSGTEIGWALDARGTEESRSFLREVLGARLAADDTNHRSFHGLGPFETSFGQLSTASTGRLELKFPDVFRVEPGFEPAFLYGASPEVAGVAGPRTLLLGFGLDHVVDPHHASRLLKAWLSSKGLQSTGPNGQPDGSEGGPHPSGNKDATLDSEANAARSEDGERGCGCRSGPLDSAPPSVVALVVAAAHWMRRRTQGRV